MLLHEVTRCFALQTMETRAGKVEEQQAQSKSAEDHFPHVPMGIRRARTIADTQRIPDKVPRSFVNLFFPHFSRGNHEFRDN